MPSRDIKDCSQILQEFFPKLKGWYEKKFPGRTLFLTCTYRSTEEQQAIFAQNKPGHILTRCDGLKKLSNHNYKPSHAFDVAISDKDMVQWRDDFYTPLGCSIKDLGYEGKIRWGGWFSFRDYPHFEEIL